MFYTENASVPFFLVSKKMTVVTKTVGNKSSVCLVGFHSLKMLICNYCQQCNNNKKTFSEVCGGQKFIAITQHQPSALYLSWGGIISLPLILCLLIFILITFHTLLKFSVFTILFCVSFLACQTCKNILVIYSIEQPTC